MISEEKTICKNPMDVKSVRYTSYTYNSNIILYKKVKGTPIILYAICRCILYSNTDRRKLYFKFPREKSRHGDPEGGEDDKH